VEPSAPLPAVDDETPPSPDAAAPPQQPVQVGAACYAFDPGGRAARAPSPGCAGPARDLVTGERDRAALRKVEEVINDHYLYVGLDNGLALLLGTSDACEARCSAPVQARVWMYIGILYGSGMARPDQAQCAFERAIAWDPGVPFDKDLATEATKAAFAAARARVCSAAPVPSDQARL